MSLFLLKSKCSEYVDVDVEVVVLVEDVKAQVGVLDVIIPFVKVDVTVVVDAI